MTETACLLLADTTFLPIYTAIWAVFGLVYGNIARKAGYEEGYSEAIDYAKKHIHILTGLGRRR